VSAVVDGRLCGCARQGVCLLPGPARSGSRGPPGGSVLTALSHASDDGDVCAQVPAAAG
jgi:hypothetical protein